MTVVINMKEVARRKILQLPPGWVGKAEGGRLNQGWVELLQNSFQNKQTNKTKKNMLEFKKTPAIQYTRISLFCWKSF